MTDDELDRALFALPLEEPPADMHQRIMAATVLRAAPAFRQWELWLLAAAVALVGCLAVYVFTSAPDPGTHLADSINAVLRTIGLSSVWWISSLPFMATPRPNVYNR
jgi:hypothetical protein